jgi:hypothetical protein
VGRPKKVPVRACEREPRRVADWARPKGKKGSALLGYQAKTERGEGIRRIPFSFVKQF